MRGLAILVIAFRRRVLGGRSDSHALCGRHIDTYLHSANVRYHQCPIYVHTGHTSPIYQVHVTLRPEKTVAQLGPYFTCFQNPHVVFSVTGRDLGASDIPLSVPAKTSHLEARQFSFTPAAAFLSLDIPLALLDAINVMDQQLLSRANHTSLSPLTLRSVEQQELAN
jgi:hypothetical protein